MVVIKDPSKFIFLGFEKSHLPKKKYNAVLYNTKTKRFSRVPFGDSSYQHYKDTTGLNLYTNLNHNDKTRRKLYRKRHFKTSRNVYSSSYFSFFFLW